MTEQSVIDAKLIEQCANEPIHIPGAIQSFGVLLTVERENLQIQNVSENCAAWFGLPARELVGLSLSNVFSEVDVNSIRQYLASENLSEQMPLGIASAMNAGAQREWKLRAHENQGIVFLELEQAAATGTSDVTPFYRRIQDAISALHRTKSLKALCDATAHQVKHLTGFDRVMIYRFDPDWNGVVVAEACDPGVDSYLGHYFPASDIPPQARAIFLENWLRMIPDVDYVPSRICPERQQATGTPLNLGRTLLRSVSPIHLQYLRNMNVRASLTISLISDGKLWGLIACHHRSPLFIDTEARTLATVIGQLASFQLHVKEVEEGLDYREDLRQMNRQLVELLEGEDEFAAGLQKYASQMLSLLGAQSGAIFYKDEWHAIGDSPSIDEMEAIVAWLSDHMPANGIFHTDSLGSHIPEAVSLTERASGLLALQLTKVERNYILLFRPEVATTVTWAGGPEKTVVQIDGKDMLHPRASFKSWKEVVKSKSLPWKAVEVEVAEQLRNSLLSVALQQELRSEQASRKLAEKLSLEKEEVVMVVAHDLRTPLSVIAMCFDFLQRVKPSEDTVVRRMIERGVYGVEAMKTLISEVLDIAKIESGTLKLELRPEPAEEMAEMTVNFFLPLASEKNIHLVLSRSAASLMVLCERNRIMQVFSNLIGNALKFTSSGGEIIVSAEEKNDRVVFSVEDTGAGISEQNLRRVFDRFWQAHGTKKMGTGLGLWISKSIVEKHGGEIWAESQSGAGSKFCFSLPMCAAPTSIAATKSLALFKRA